MLPSPDLLTAPRVSQKRIHACIRMALRPAFQCFSHPQHLHDALTVWYRWGFEMHFEYGRVVLYMKSSRLGFLGGLCLWIEILEMLVMKLSHISSVKRLCESCRQG